MSQYGILFPEFWTGTTGRAIRKRGGKDAQLLALYTMSSRHANMLGLYYVPKDFIAQETGLSVRAITRAFPVLADVEFARYDDPSQVVWVREMAKFRLGLNADNGHLAKKDRRVIAVQRIFAALPTNPFLTPFLERYGPCLHLSRKGGAA